MVNREPTLSTAVLTHPLRSSKRWLPNALTKVSRAEVVSVLAGRHRPSSHLGSRKRAHGVCLRRIAGNLGGLRANRPTSPYITRIAGVSVHRFAFDGTSERKFQFSLGKGEG